MSDLVSFLHFWFRNVQLDIYGVLSSLFFFFFLNRHEDRLGCVHVTGLSFWWKSTLLLLLISEKCFFGRRGRLVGFSGERESMGAWKATQGLWFIRLVSSMFTLLSRIWLGDKSTLLRCLQIASLLFLAFLDFDLSFVWCCLQILFGVLYIANLSIVLFIYLKTPDVVWYSTIQTLS